MLEAAFVLPNGSGSVLIVSGFEIISSPVVIKIYVYSFDLEKNCNFLFLLQDKNFL